MVFNERTEELREIVIVPDFEWGGEGCLGCDVGSGMVHWIPKKIDGLRAASPKSQMSQQQMSQASSPGSPGYPVTSLPPVGTQASLLQAQYQQQTIPSQAPLFAESQIPQVNVSVPSARPVVNLSSSEPQQQSVSQAIFPESVPAPALAPPPMTNYHHHSHNDQNAVIDDIPMPNFTVPSDIINQK